MSIHLLLLVAFSFIVPQSNADLIHNKGKNIPHRTTSMLPTTTQWEDAFSGSSIKDEDDDDEEALKWAAIEKLDSFRRLQTAVLKVLDENGEIRHDEVDVTKLRLADRQGILKRVLAIPEEDHEHLLRKFRERIDRVGLDLPKIEVRFSHLNVTADVHIGKRALPTLYNFVVNIFVGLLGAIGLSPSKKRVLNILNDLNGIIQPSKLTLLLGPPNAGKTTLLLALAGKLDSDLGISGKILYNGHELTKFVPQKTSAYISQKDIHIAELTVRETLDFAGRCQGVGSRYEMLLELARREKAAGIKPDPDLDIFLKATAVQDQDNTIATDYIMKILGLDICSDIIVGNELVRGISGGQKKRLTTGEMLVGPAKALFMDEISTGLDSATTYQIVKCMRQFVHLMDATILISLLQPAPETYDLFDDLILLSEGRILYQGPCDKVLDFFESLGFKCPERKGTADFLQEVISKKDQEQYWADKSRPYKYITTKEICNAFSEFHVGKLVAHELATPFDKSKSHPAALVTKKYALSNWSLLKACVTRDWILMKRNYFIYVFKSIQVCLVAAIGMTVFLRTQYHTTVSDGNTLMGSLFFSLAVLFFNGFAELSLTVMKLPIFFKQRDLKFYPAWAFALSSWIMKIPLSLSDSAIYTLMTYWVIGYAPEAKRFFRQFLVLFFQHSMAMGLFRFAAALGRTMVLAMNFGFLCMVAIVVLGGFVVSRGSLHPWWRWAYWLSPMMYGQNAIAVNEFLASRWNKPGDGLNTIGITILKARELFPHAYWYWIGIGAYLVSILFFHFTFTISLAYLNPLGKPQPIIMEESADENVDCVKDAIDFQPNVIPTSKRAGIRKMEKGMILPFQPLSLTFHHINYYVDMPVEMKQQGETKDRLQLLQDVSGAFRPGVLTALVGVSGAGKTTLMDVLAGRKTGGYIEGTIKVSGFPKKQETFARISGYCEQNDVHSPHVTIYESLIYSAWLRLPKSIDEGTRKAFVEEVMELVELVPLRDAIVGLPGINGLSTEQRKRLTIAVELVVNPSIIFMDEPTSGLDARAAAIVMRTVRNTVDTGRTVVCTIHQPSIDIFESFDELLLMQRGGQLIYAGPLGKMSCRLIDYLEGVSGIPKIANGYNPATWMLEVTSEAMERRLKVNFVEIYYNSSVYAKNEELINQLSVPIQGREDLSFPTTYAQPILVQCGACLWKQYYSYWHNPLYSGVRMLYTIFFALFVGTIFWGFGKTLNTEQQLFNVMGSIFTVAVFLGVYNAQTVQPIIGVERTVFYRERGAGMYSALPYAFGQLVIEIPYVFAQALVYTIITYPMLALEWTAPKFLWFLFFIYISGLYFTYYGMMSVAITPNHGIAAVVSTAFYGIWSLFCGFIISRPKIPIWWRWYYWANPVAWTINGLLTSQLGDKETLITVTGGGTQMIKEYLKHHFGFHHDFLGVISAMNIVFVIIFALAFSFGIKFLNFQKR